MIYLACFILCILVDNLKKRRYTAYHLLIAIIATILCFGYTCGSDWRHYEIMYNTPEELDRYRGREFGFVTYFEFLHLLIPDFWITNAISKIFFLYSLASFFKTFTKNNWTCIAISFAFKTLFLIIDCPMRFMLAMAILLLGMKSLLNRQLLRYGIFVVIAVVFQNTIIIIAILNILLLYTDRLFEIKKFWMLLITMIFFIISRLDFVYIKAFDMLGSLLNLSDSGDNRILFYAFFNLNGRLINIENIWHFCFLLLIIFNKALIAKVNYGKVIVIGSWLYITLGYVFNPIPTGFRLSILFGFFFVLGIQTLLHIGWRCWKRNYSIISTSMIVWLMIVIGKDVYSLPAYYPYTNSIPYIIIGHLPYEYRTNYNYEEYEKNIGTLPERSSRDVNDNLINQ